MVRRIIHLHWVCVRACGRAGGRAWRVVDGCGGERLTGHARPVLGPGPERPAATTDILSDWRRQDGVGLILGGWGRAAQDGMCGIATTASYPIKTGPNPPKPPPVPQTCDLCADLPHFPLSHLFSAREAAVPSP